MTGFSSTTLPLRAARKVARMLGLGRLRALHRRRFGWRGAGHLAGYRLFDPMLVEYSAGITEARVTEAIAAVVQPGWTCLDVGAHKGYFTLLLAHLAGEAGRVISFEAHPDNAAATQRHAEVNGVAERVQVVNQAVSDGKESEVVLYFGRDSSPFEWNIIGHDVLGRATQAALRVPCIALDSYFPSGEGIDFVKMDIEGAEGMALAGMQGILEESQPILLVEFHNQEVWEARRELIPETYTIYDISKGAVVPREQDEFVHQCLAIPASRAAGTVPSWAALDSSRP